MKKKELTATIKYAGAFIAWVIGSGFATGQEILQFFTSYSVKSFAVLGICLLGFVIIGVTLLVRGFDNRESAVSHYEYYCGKTVGKIYAWIIPVTLLLLMSVLISAAGATLHQYYGLNKYIGSVLLAMLVLTAYVLGFEKMVSIVSLVGPVIIVFSVFVGLFTVLRDINASGIAEGAAGLADAQAAPHWSVSALLYLSLNFLCGSTYYNELGKTAYSRRSAKLGALIGAVILILTILVMNLAILLNAKAIGKVSVPTLYLAKLISPVFGSVFSVVLFLGMFSSCSTMMWSFCSGFFKKDKTKNKLFAAATAAVCLAAGLLPFDKLVSVFYPMIGYAGLFFIGCCVYKGFRKS